MTDDPNAHAVREFESRRHLYEKLKIAVVGLLEEALGDQGLDKRIHGGVTSRVKDIDSFRKKIADKPYTNPLAETRDLLGVRIVCPYPSVLREIDAVIRETFAVVGCEDKSKVESPEVWRYSSVHYDCELHPGPTGLPDDDITGLVFEMQVRTVLQDAWATVEHRLGYKGPRHARRSTLFDIAGCTCVLRFTFGSVPPLPRSPPRQAVVAALFAPQAGAVPASGSGCLVPGGGCAGGSGEDADASGLGRHDEGRVIQ